MLVSLIGFAVLMVLAFLGFPLGFSMPLILFFPPLVLLLPRLLF